VQIGQEPEQELTRGPVKLGPGGEAMVEPCRPPAVPQRAHVHRRTADRRPALPPEVKGRGRHPQALQPGRIQVMRGVMPAMPQSAAIIQLVVDEDKIRRLDALHDLPAIRAQLAPLSADRLGVTFAGSVEQAGFPARARYAIELLGHLLASVQESAGLTLFARPVATSLSPAGSKKPGLWTMQLICPSPHPALLAGVAPEVMRILNVWLAGRSFAQLPAALEQVIAQLARFAPGGQNMRLLIDAGYRLGVPSCAVSGRAIQFGWGSRSRWVDSSVTDRTSAIATRIARDKRAASRFLAARGVPVPRQVDVPTREAAITAAQTLGFPVVVKPADLDGGVGVTAGLDNEAAVGQAYDLARRHSARIVVETQVPGEDVRLGVVHGQVAWATMREPAGVHGDGTSSVQQLIDLANQDVRRGRRNWSLMSPLSVNAEAEALLATQGLDLTDVPAQGQFVRLCSAANISSGGTPVNVRARVHPDNQALAIRAARLMRLDIAGIDLIIPDVSRSWREVGGAICEVNAQPQFSIEAPDVPFRLVADLFAGDGRIPVVVALGPVDMLSPEIMVAAFRARGLTLGLVLPAHCSVDGCPVDLASSGTFDAVQALLVDPGVDAIVALVDDESWLRTGAPLDRVDLLFVAEGASRRMKGLLAPLQTIGQRTLAVEPWREMAGAQMLADEVAQLAAWHDDRPLCVDRAASAALSASPYARKAPPRPGSIGLCMIAKNEASIIRESLDSVRGIVDFVLVQDTGSTDGTQQVVRQWLAENRVAGTVVEVPWRDFAWNRTRALADLRACHDIDYALVLDADDLLVPEDGFDATAFKAGLVADSYDLTIHYGALRFARVQLLRNAKAFRYRGVVHEYIEPPADSVGRQAAKGLYIKAHSRGARSRNRRKYEEDAALLERALDREREPKLRSRYLFYLGQSYQDGGQFTKALDAYLRRAAMDGWPEEKFIATYRAADLQAQLGWPLAVVEATFRRAMEIAPDRLEAYHGLSRLLRMTGRPAEGFAVGEQGLRFAGKKRDGLFLLSSIYHYGLLEETALNARLAGEYRQCARYCDAILALDDVPEQTRTRIKDCLASLVENAASAAAPAMPSRPCLPSLAIAGDTGAVR